MVAVPARVLVAALPALALAASPLKGPTSGIGGPNMNGEYQIMRGGKTMVAAKGYAEQGYGKTEWFDVYSPEIKTLYGQVFWTMMEGTPLPPSIISRFRNKTMAVVGYECNQVGQMADGTEFPIPINAAYNHHHGSMLMSTDAVIKKVPAPLGFYGHADGDGMVWAAEDQRPVGQRTGPASTTFHEGNGGEYRKSYHGYSLGHAQLVESPASFHMQPMQIDTWNRSNINATTGGPSHKFMPGIQPKNSAQLAPDALYSGLLECPCTTRITKQIAGASSMRAAGVCHDGGPATLAECRAAALVQLKSWRMPGHFGNVTAKSGKDPLMPPGCSVTVLPPDPESSAKSEGKNPPGDASVFFNELATQATACGGTPSASASLWGASLKDNAQPVGFYVAINATHIELTVSGPADVWYGIALNTSTMAGKPWALIVDGVGAVSEHALGNEEAGSLLPKIVTVLSTTVGDGRRTVVAARPLAGLSRFDLAALRENMNLPMIVAVGSGPKFAYHKQKTATSVAMFALGQPTCVCEGSANIPFGGGKGKLIYTPVADEPGGSNSKVAGAPATSLGFAKQCLPYPASTMLLEKNPSCDLRAYTGGQSCCHHMFTLLDKDQKTPNQDKFLIYRMKWRFWFQEVTPENPIKDLTQFNWGGMASPTEYDVPKCGEGVFGCTKMTDGHWTHTMNGTWTVGDMHPSPSRKNEPEPRNGTGVRFLSIHGHCHAPTCIQFDLFNAETNEIICSQRPLYGNGAGHFQEEGYLNIPPCVFGSEAEGLISPPGGDKGLPFATRLFSKKTCHADYAHHGEMSLWQTYGELVA